MDYFLLIIAILFMLTGIVGCLVPVLPGPPLSYLGLVIVHFTRFADVSQKLFIILGIIAVAVTST